MQARPSVGIVLGEDPLALRIATVLENTVAAAIGLLPGDIVMAVGDDSIEALGSAAAVELWYHKLAEGHVPVTVLRGGRELTLSR